MNIIVNSYPMHQVTNNQSKSREKEYTAFIKREIIAFEIGAVGLNNCNIVVNVPAETRSAE